MQAEIEVIENNIKKVLEIKKEGQLKVKEREYAFH